jgi:DNA repair exonuclease SbcCD ATPase subunit
MVARDRHGGAAEADMRRLFLTLAVAACVFLPLPLAAQEKLTPSNLPGFIAACDQNLESLQTAFTELTEEELKLRDEDGRPLGRRPIEDRRQALADLRETAHQLVASPKDLVLITKLAFQTENLADDLFDLAQTAYDNDREELARQLSDLQAAMDHNRDMLESYLLDSAAENQERLQQLERENAELREKLKEAPVKSHAKLPAQRLKP